MSDREVRQGELRAARRRATTRPQALDAARQSIREGHALVLSPARCRLERLGSLEPEELNGDDAPYEMRLFGERGEVRWVQTGWSGEGNAVAVGEDLALPGGWQADEPLQVLVLERSYVLSAMVYEMAVDAGAPPVETTGAGSRPEKLLGIAAREYLGEVDRYGNVGVLVERLFGITEVKVGTWPEMGVLPDEWSVAEPAEDAEG